MSTRDFPTAIVLSLTTSRLLVAGGFGDVHRLAEWVAGHPIWTQELADRLLWRALRDAIGAQHPAVLDDADLTADNWQAWTEARVAALGPTLAIAQGDTERLEDPISSLVRLCAAAKAERP